MTTVDLEQQRLLIGGEWVEASGGGTFERADPLTGEPVTLAAAAGREDARPAVEAAATPRAYGSRVDRKASGQGPRPHAAGVGALVDAGLPPGAVNLIIPAPEDAPDVVDELIAHPATRRVNFTGSSRVGKIVGMKC